ncbi:hypothetical protein TNCV_3651061 [Trichonephila clavipes]|nr:hypothetical protein TNCV_3651061 [Trichonephila clavipes]
MAEATIPVTTPIKEEKGMDDLRVVYVKVKGEQEMVNAVIDTGAQMPVVRPDVVEGQSIDNRGSIQITSAFGEHEMGEVKDSNMELNDFRHGVVPVSKNLVNDMLICFSDYEVLIENSQMIRNPAKLREPSKEEGIISSTDLKSVCSQEVITNLRPETYTQSLLNVPNGDLVAVKINASNVQTNGQGIKESKREVAFTCVFKNRILYSNRRGQPRKECISEFIDSILVQCCCDLITGIVKLELKAGLEVFKVYARACPSGSTGAFCKHQCALMELKKIRLPNAPPVTPEDKHELALLSLGSKCPPKDFFCYFKNNELSSDRIESRAFEMPVEQETDIMQAVLMRDK